MSKVPITVDGLRKFLVLSVNAGTTEAWAQMALDWADQANDEIARLRADRDRLDWIECRAMNGQVQIAQSLFKSGYEIATHQGVQVCTGPLRRVLDKVRAETG